MPIFSSCPSAKDYKKDKSSTTYVTDIENNWDSSCFLSFDAIFSNNIAWHPPFSFFVRGRPSLILSSEANTYMKCTRWITMRTTNCKPVAISY